MAGHRAALVAHVADEWHCDRRLSRYGYRGRQEKRLIELAAAGSLPIAKVDERIEKASLQKKAIKKRLKISVDRLQCGTDTALAYIDLPRESGHPFTRVSDTVRRDVLTVLFESLAVRVEINELRVSGKRQPVNARVHEISTQLTLAGAAEITFLQKGTSI